MFEILNLKFKKTHDAYQWIPRLTERKTALLEVSEMNYSL